MGMRSRAICLLLVLFSFSAHCQAQSSNPVTPEDEYSQLIKTAQTISPLGPHPFGEHINLYDGTLSFEVTDITVPGIGPTLTVGRTLRPILSYLPLQQLIGDWDLDIPRIETNTANQANVTGWFVASYGSPGYLNRCTQFGPPPMVTPAASDAFAADEYWYGYHLIIPGEGSQDLLGRGDAGHSPTSGSYPITTKRDWMISCGVTASDGGDGFVALAPDGTRYTFSHLVYRYMADVEMPFDTSPYAATAGGASPMVNQPSILQRRDALMYVTKVQDRFGNTLTYNWDGDNLTSIVASDGRKVSLTYFTPPVPNPDGELIHTITVEATDAPARTWTYNYDYPGNVPTLTSVQLPDGSAWSYQTGTLVTGLVSVRGDDCNTERPPVEVLGGGSGSMTTPSGLTATFTVTAMEHGRSYVPKQCIQPPGMDSSWAVIPDLYTVSSLTTEAISGPGITPATWHYSYSTPTPSFSSDACATDQTCPATVYTDVEDPLGHTTRSTFSNRFDATEGLLLNTVLYSGAVGTTVLRSTVDDYAKSNSGPWPTSYGVDPQDHDNHWQVTGLSPLQQRTITQDGATFIMKVNSFDSFARATSETESGSSSKTVATRYHDDLDLWVLGQVESTAVSASANVVAGPCTAGDTSLESCTTYDPNTALPVDSYAFGKLVSARAWNTNGTLTSTTDGRSNTTTFSNWKRGIPQGIGYADGSSRSAVVNDNGWITSVTDENIYTTGYKYDPMGRLSEIDYPTGDSVDWNSTYISFVPYESGSEYGIPAGHWKQTVCTGTAAGNCNGNYYKITYFDALWRPLVSETYDASNKSGTLSQIVTRYDTDGRKVFTSYPLNNVGGYSSDYSGTTTDYDALDRVTEVDQDSELSSTNPLQTFISYLPGFKAQVMEPKGSTTTTTTSYLTYGEPDYSYPSLIVAPEGETTTISRDIYGKPLQINRAGPYNGGTLSLARSYVYDAHQQLCKWIDPESGTTAMAYDDAGNLQWSAAGLALPSTTSCDTDTAYDSGRRVDRSYDQRNRIQAITYPDGFSNTSYTYYPDGASKTETADNGGQPITTTYDYDKRRLLTGEAVAIPGLSPSSVGYGYDINGHLAATTYPDGRSVTYLPNALGQATQVGSYATTVSYYPNGAIRQFAFGDGALHTMAQNVRQFPDRITDALNGTTGHDEGYDYDADANVGAITDYVSSTQNRDMFYDGLDRLTETDSPMFSGDGKAVYTYDVLDNLRSARVGNVSNFKYQYDASNRLYGLTDPLSGSSIASYFYDLQGNLAKKNNQTYQFDEGNRLRGVPGVASYLYDGGGRRVQKDEIGSNTTLYADYSKGGALMYQWNPGTLDATDYIYLGGSLVAKVVNNESQVIGNIDGLSSDGSAVLGWACSTSIATPISVQLYVGGPWNGDDGASGTLIATVTANQHSEPAVASACHSSGTAYRFSIPLSTAVRSQYPNEPIYVYGLSPVGNLNGELTGSGQYAVPPNPSAPAAPAAITVPSSNVGGSFTVSWSPSSGATGYVLQQQFNMMPTWNQVYAGSSASAVVSTGSGEYAFRVQACNANGCSDFSTPSPWVTVVPAMPAAINVPSSSYIASFGVSWSASAIATNYVLEQSTNGGAWGYISSNSGTSTTVTVPATGNYRYQVAACGAGGCSDYLASGSVAVTLPPATAPSLSGPSSSSSGTFTLSWSPVAGATSYHLHQSVNGGPSSLIDTTPGNSWSSNGLGNGSYVYSVCAANAAGCGPSSSSLTVSVLHVPAIPASVTAPLSVTLNTMFSVGWSASSGATSYTLRQTDTDDGTVKTKYTGAGTSAAISIGLPGFYQYSVQACNSVGCSGWRSATHTTDAEPSGGPRVIQASTPASGGSR